LPVAPTASTAERISSKVDIPVEIMSGRPVARALRSSGRSVSEALAIL
jgi:hypothetical protein